MKHVPMLAMSAGATSLASVLATRPSGVHAMPRADVSDPAALVAQIQAGWTEFKGTIEANLGKKADDVVVNNKLDAINADLAKFTTSLDHLSAQLAAASLGGGGTGSLTPEAVEHSQAFNAWFRKGREPAAGLREMEIKARLTTQSDPDGGYLVPVEMEKGIDRVLGTVSTVRSLSRVISVSSSEYDKLVNMGGAGSGWVGEEDARPETSTPTLRKIAINTGEIYAEPAATQTSLDDGIIDVAAWLADEVSITFAEQEGAAFVNGNGKKKPRGILQYDTVDNSSYAWGKVGFKVTGAAAAFAASNPADAIIDLYYALKAGYRNGATWLTSDAVMGAIRKFKDGQGNYLWSPPTGADMPATILGKPVATDDNMPALSAGAFPVAFGNFQRGYLITDRTGVRVLRDPYTSKPNVLFYTTKRVGGGVVNFEAIKLLKCST